MDDYIKRKDAINYVYGRYSDQLGFINVQEVIEQLQLIPAANVKENSRGQWIDREISGDDELNDIEEWQSAKCSVCGKYHTTPYVHYFERYPHCPHCGAKMEGEGRWRNR